MSRHKSNDTKSGFFAIDVRIWPLVCNLGVNPAVAYLVLAQGTQRNNRTTSWSANSVENYTGISRSRAKRAIEDLIGDHVLLLEKGGTRPRYQLANYEEHPEATLSSKSEKDKELLWLPNELVTGSASETPPVELLRQSQDISLLRTFVELYGSQNLVEDAGLPRKMLSLPFDRKRIGEKDQFIVWGFRRTAPMIGDHAPKSFLEMLLQLGLIKWTDYLVDSPSTDAEIIVNVGSMEQELLTGAAKSLLTTRQWNRFGYDFDYLVPVFQHRRQVQMVGIAQLTYKPRTRMSSKWFVTSEQDRASLETICRHLITPY